ncbi:hypothetical protein [Actinosynnema sp. NPDC023587]|uniref:hypothetical protein n=1 Tax=Actinosynnema sp. NPDC023587 TaxID=3154695 RepID=UPI0033FA0DE3
MYFVNTQMPHDMRGQPLCQHTRPGNCTWWCSYRRAVICIAPVVGLMIAGGLLMWFIGGDLARDQVAQAFAGVALVLAVGIPAVIFTNHSSSAD